MGTYAVRQIYERIRQHQSTIVFVNTRTQVELVFKELWRVNDDALPIALHHGSLSPEKRRVVEDRMAKGDLRAVVATSSLDLGLDWGAIDLVIQLGAPKGVSRLLQRIGRANHRLDDPSKAILVPANRFQMLECRAAVEAIAEDDLDGAPVYDGGYDVAAQHIWGVACHGPFDPDELYREMTGAAPFKNLKREIFNDLIQFVASGGYALSNYERFQRIIRRDDGKYHLADKKSARQYRLNVGTIVSAQMMKVKLNKRRTLGSVEEYFVSNLTPGDRFMFAGQTLTFQGVRDNDVFVTKGGGGEPSVPNYIGGRMPLSTHLATRVRRHLADPESWGGQFAKPVADWLVKQTERSVMPAHDGLLVETFPRGGPDNERHFMVAYPFAGRNAHQTLGMLLTRRMERFGLNPLGFSATDYAISIWGLTPADDHIHDLFDPDILGDDLEEWMEESPMLRRTFRSVALVSGLIQERHPGKQKTGRQVTMNTDLIYDVLRDHEPGHILLKATRKQAAKGLTDIRRLNDLLTEVQGKITHHHLDRASPLSIPILMEAGREKVDSPDSEEALLREAGLIN
jgi:ATP-dependent Lhr-like helicase